MYYSKTISRTSITLCLSILLSSLIALGQFSGATQKAQAADFDPNNLISDASFININSMSASQIQTFLEARGGFLKDFSENGRKASQIIYDASHGYGDASNTGGIPINGILLTPATGTVNPQVLLVTLQKEQGLLTILNRNDDSLRTAMGYGCPDSGGCNAAYAGFTKQVENAAWQLRYNYERAQGTGFSDYQVGQTITPTDYNGVHTATFSNRATAALYRYTPHVYNGNYNFWNLMNLYFSRVTARWAGQSDNKTLVPGQSAPFSLSFVNTSNRTWTKTGPAPMHLAINKDKQESLNKRFRAGNWLSSDRVAAMNQDSVAPGQVASFNFDLAMPSDMAPGSYQFFVRLVLENEQWLDEEFGAWWKLTAPTYTAHWAGQSNNLTLAPGQDGTLSVGFLNDGAMWNAGGPAAVHLAINKDKEEAVAKRFYNSSWLSTDRIAALPENVGQAGVPWFSFPVHVPTDMAPGTYNFHVRLVSENYMWFSDATAGAWWTITVATPRASYVGQTPTVIMPRGGTAAIAVTFKNAGSTTWYSTGAGRINLAVSNTKSEATNKLLNSGWLSADRIMTLPKASVAPGENVTFVFNISVPSELPPGSYQFYVRLVSENVLWLDEATSGAWWQINVQ